MKIQKLIFTLLLFCSAISVNAQWQQIGSISPSETPALITSIVNQNVIWFGGYNLVTGTSLIYKTTNGGVNFISIPTIGIRARITCIIAFDENTVVAGDDGSALSTAGGGGAALYKTTNSGQNWVMFSANGTTSYIDGISRGKINANFAFAVGDPLTVFAGMDNYSLYTINNGANWIRKDIPETVNIAPNFNSFFAVDELFYGYGCYDNNASANCLVKITTNGGANWSLKNTGLPGNYINSVDFVNKLNGIAIGSTMDKISRTTNGGLNWAVINTGVVSNALNPLLKWVENSNTIYISAATSNASEPSIIKSTNGGLNWAVMTNGGTTAINSIDIKYIGNSVTGFISSSFGPVAKLNETVTNLGSIAAINPDNFKLNQNYPNPFNPSTIISFSITKESNVKLSVFDLNGKLIRELINDYKEAGNYEFNFISSELSSGTYIYRMQAGNYYESKKFTLIK